MARVYLAGPITGLSYEEARNGWRKDFAALLNPSIEPLSPMRQEGHLAEIKDISAHGYDEHLLSTSKGIVAKDLLDIDRCTIVVMNFLGSRKVSIGSVWEMGYAKRARKPIVVVMEPDPDPAEELEHGRNPHDHCFIIETADFRCASVAEAAAITNALLTPGV